jgi:hypothetical protein
MPTKRQCTVYWLASNIVVYRTDAVPTFGTYVLHPSCCA